MSNISKKNLSTKEVEDLSYYDFMSYLGASFYQIGGPKSTLKLARQCHIDKDSKVLDVGCGTGYNACLIAEEFGCTVVGVDISELSIEKARERAEKQGLTELVEFHVGDAYDLPFEYEGFDVVITEFVSQFLDLKQAFKEFTRVLKKGGYIGINEMYKDDEIPTTPAEEIKMAEDMISDLTKLPFKLNTPRHWKSLFIEAGLRDVEINKSQEYLGVKDLSYIIGEAGGLIEFTRIMGRVIKFGLISGKIRKRFKVLQKTKAVFLRTKSTSRHVGYVLGTGKKGGNLK